MFYDAFAQLCKEKNTTPSRAAQDMNINKSTVTYWKSKDVVPNGSTLNKIADYFSVTTDYLLGNGKKPTAKSDELTMNSFKYALLNESEELTDDNKAKLLEMAKFFKMQQEKEK